MFTVTDAIAQVDCTLQPGSRAWGEVYKAVHHYVIDPAVIAWVKGGISCNALIQRLFADPRTIRAVYVYLKSN